MILVKKRKTDDIFKLYRSAVKQYPLLRFVVATKCVEYLHEFELANHFYNVKIKKDFNNAQDKGSELITKAKKESLILIDKAKKEAEEAFNKINIQLETIKSKNLKSKEIKKIKKDMELQSNLVQTNIINAEEEASKLIVKAEEEASRLVKQFSKDGVNPIRLDFSKFITCDTIIRNTFEIGLVTDERKKGDIIGRKGILAADLRKREIEEVIEKGDPNNDIEFNDDD